MLFLPFLISNSVKSQDSTGYSDVSKVSSKYFDAVSKKANTLQQNLDRKSQKVLERMQKQEAKLQKKLAKIDSLASHNIFSNSAEKYNDLEEKLKTTGELSRYIPKLDTIATSLKFLDQHPEFLANTKDAKEKLAGASETLNEFKDKLKNAEDIKQFLKERKQYLKEQLEKFGFAKDLKKINKEVYYYSEQINEYREILKDPKKIEQKSIELLTKTKLFQDFMKKNSFLASLFRMPDNPSDPANVANFAGLQTRTQVNSLIQNQVASGGGQRVFQQNIQQGQSQLQLIKDKISKWGGGNGDDVMPEGFKPNSQKTKSFFKRLEFGANIQTQKSTNFFPTISDIGLSMGFKLNDKSIIGIGTSFKVGWGTGWKNIHITQQGLSFRSFIDWKLKGTIWISGGYEQNLMAVINNFDQLRDISAWQQSGLLGISKVLSVKSKVFRKTKVQLLWDFLSYKQVPNSSPLLFRINYSFN